MTDNGLILEAQADFSVKLLREVSGGKSTIVSPISVAIALSMVYAGAENETANEMNKMLANGAPESKVHQYFGELMASIRNGQKNYTLEVANKVYVKEGFSILDAFKTTIDQHYGGLFESVDFEQKQETANKINHFVEEATHDKIRNLIKPDSLDEFTRLILINAIYFKGNWANKFNADRTQKKTFYASPGQEKQLDMMQKTAKFIYSDAQNYQVLGMPYVGEEVFMFIVLPKERYGLEQVLANLSGKELLDLVQMRYKEEVDVVLPKFKLESTHALNDPLKKLGIARAFSDDAQFGGITEKAPLKISEVIQKAFIEVNEEGTEAAAATGLIMMNRSLVIHEKAKFIADHPFAFLLVSNQNTQILFNGIFQLGEAGTICYAVTLFRPTACACYGDGEPLKPKFIADHPFAFFLANFRQGHYRDEQQIDFYSLPTLFLVAFFSETNEINRNYYSAFAPIKFDEKSGERVDRNGFGKLLSSKSNERKFFKANDLAARGDGEKLPKANENIIPGLLSLITPIEKVKSEEENRRKHRRNPKISHRIYIGLLELLL